jgi:hypothetical protein
LRANALHLLAVHYDALFAAKAVDDLTASLLEATIAICGLGLLFRFEVGLLACGAAGRGGHPVAIAASGDLERLAGRAHVECGVIGPEPEDHLDPLRLLGRLWCALGPPRQRAKCF